MLKFFLRNFYIQWIFILLAVGSLMNLTSCQSSKPYFNGVSLNDQHRNPYFKDNHSVIVHLVNWNFSDIAEECEKVLGPTGFAGVQISPVTLFNTSVEGHPFWQRYQPISYNISSPAGDEVSFREMSERCNRAGVRIYVDVVLNHMGPKFNKSDLNYTDIPYRSEDFHKDCEIKDDQDPHTIRNCRSFGNPDLDHSKDNVKKSIIQFLNKLIDLGVAGFHIFGAQNIWPIDLKSFYESLNDLNEVFGFPENSKPFIMQDVLDLHVSSISKTEYTTYGTVSDYLYAVTLSDLMSGRVSLENMANWGPAMGFVLHQDALVFVDDFYIQMLREVKEDYYHTSSPNYYELLNLDSPDEYLKALAFMIFHPFGKVKRLVSTCGNRNECCLHHWKPLLDVISFSNSLSVEEDPVTNFQTKLVNQVAFCRGEKAFIAFNNDLEEDFEQEVETCLEEGVYCDILTGGLSENRKECRGRSLVVKTNGSALLQLPAIEIDGIEFSCETDNDSSPKNTFSFLAISLDSKIVDHAENSSEANLGETIDIDEYGKNNSSEMFTEDQDNVESSDETSFLEVTTIESTFSV